MAEEKNVSDKVEQANQQVTKPAVPSKNTKTNTGLIVTIVIVSIVVLVGMIVGGWYGYKAIKKKFGTITSSSTSSTVSTTTTTITTGSTGASTKSGTMPVNGYVIADSNTRVISESELTGLSPWQLKVARNEIYARHGRPFVHKDLQCYFATQNWYTKDDNFSNDSLSAIDNKNIATILNYEKKTNSPILEVDTGCK